MTFLMNCIAWWFVVGSGITGANLIDTEMRNAYFHYRGRVPDYSGKVMFDFMAIMSAPAVLVSFVAMKLVSVVLNGIARLR